MTLSAKYIHHISDSYRRTERKKKLTENLFYWNVQGERKINRKFKDIYID